MNGLVSELEAVHEEVLQEVTIIAFRDYARETLTTQGRMGTKPGERMYHFLLGLAGEPVSIAALKRGRHPLSQFYRGVTAKTLTRDLNFLRSHGLVIVNRDEIRANLDVMKRFVP